MEWYESRIIQICLPVIVAGIAFLLLVAPPLPENEQLVIRQVEEYQTETIRLREEMAASPWNGNYTILEEYGRMEKLLADRFLENFSRPTQRDELYDYRQEVIGALEDERAAGTDMISASLAFFEGRDSEGRALLEKATEEKRNQFFHLDQAARLLLRADAMNRLQNLPKG